MRARVYLLSTQLSCLAFVPRPASRCSQCDEICHNISYRLPYHGNHAYNAPACIPLPTLKPQKHHSPRYSYSMGDLSEKHHGFSNLPFQTRSTTSNQPLTSTNTASSIVVQSPTYLAARSVSGASPAETSGTEIGIGIGIGARSVSSWSSPARLEALQTGSTSRVSVKQRRQPIPRKGHKKSRNGCYNCKRRKVKCQENLPECYNCKRIGLTCTYPALRNVHLPVPAVAGNLPTALSSQGHGSFFTMEDMRFFHHFLFTAYPPLPIAGAKVWRNVGHLSHRVSTCLFPPIPQHLALNFFFFFFFFFFFSLGSFDVRGGKAHSVTLPATEPSGCQRLSS